jgi:hypothetical protein
MVALILAIVTASALLVATPALGAEPVGGGGVSVAAPVPGGKVTAGSARFGLSEGSVVKLRYEGAGGALASAGPTEGVQVSVGLGWYIYIYLNRGDWIYLAGLGYTAATAALCAWLLPTIAGAVACAVAAYIIGTWVIKTSAPPAGYCRELKFNYVGIFSGSKLIKRTC